MPSTVRMVWLVRSASMLVEAPADLDGDGIVEAGDIAILLGEWGEWGG